MVMGLSAECNLSVRQLDAVTSYLNGEVEEELFMEIPENEKSHYQKLWTKKSSTIEWREPQVNGWRNCEREVKRM